MHPHGEACSIASALWCSLHDEAAQPAPGAGTAHAPHASHAIRGRRPMQHASPNLVGAWRHVTVMVVDAELSRSVPCYLMVASLHPDAPIMWETHGASPSEPWPPLSSPFMEGGVPPGRDPWGPLLFIPGVPFPTEQLPQSFLPPKSCAAVCTVTCYRGVHQWAVGSPAEFR